MGEQRMHVSNGVRGTEDGNQRVGTLENQQDSLARFGVVHARVVLDRFADQGQQPVLQPAAERGDPRDQV